MANRPYDFPPFSSLVAFEAAARKAGFKLAAVELNVTPAAISHQVKSLEKDLRVALFHRHHRGVELTESGAYLFVALQRGFEEIHDALNQLRLRTDDASVSVHSTTAVSSVWLTPKLAEFWRAHSHISVSQIVSDKANELPFTDLAIRYGDMASERALCRPLFKDTIVALCSAGFRAQYPVREIADLGRVPLIQLDQGEGSWTTWQDWAGALGYDGALSISHRVNNYVIGLQAAQDGMGAILGWGSLTSELQASGALVPLFDQVLPAPQDFYIALNNIHSPNARIVFDWLSAVGPVSKSV